MSLYLVLVKEHDFYSLSYFVYICKLSPDCKIHANNLISEEKTLKYSCTKKSKSNQANQNSSLSLS